MPPNNIGLAVAGCKRVRCSAQKGAIVEVWLCRHFFHAVKFFLRLFRRLFHFVDFVSDKKSDNSGSDCGKYRSDCRSYSSAGRYADCYNIACLYNVLLAYERAVYNNDCIGKINVRKIFGNGTPCFKFDSFRFVRKRAE